MRIGNQCSKGKKMKTVEPWLFNKIIPRTFLQYSQIYRYETVFLFSMHFLFKRSFINARKSVTQMYYYNYCDKTRIKCTHSARHIYSIIFFLFFFFIKIVVLIWHVRMVHYLYIIPNFLTRLKRFNLAWFIDPFCCSSSA